MDSNLSQYLDLYLQTSREEIQILNKSLLELEKNPKDAQAIDNIFRSAHTLKSQSAAMGYQSTGFICHTIEDVFYNIKQGKLELTPEVSDQLFKSFDLLSESLNSIEKEQKEMDLTKQAETLKKLTGVQTLGVGKTIRDTDQASVTGVVEAQSTSKKIKTINVKVDTLDDMMDSIEELLVERLKLKKIVKLTGDSELKDYYEASEKIIDNLQYQITQARAIPLNVIFEHFPRAIRDISKEENKEVELVIEGGDLELDRTIVDKLDEPIIHILRNAVSHGIKEKGKIKLSAKREKDTALISVADNGMGIEWDKLVAKSGRAKGERPEDLLFSGISTSDKVSQISGRGVGLKTVKSMVEEFGGSIDVTSEKNKGTTFTIKLPLTLAIAKALLVKVGNEDYAIPTLSIDRILKVPQQSIKRTADQEAFILEETEVPLIKLAQMLKLAQGDNNSMNDFTTVVIQLDNERLGIVVDEVVETTDIVIKPIPAALKGIKQFSGTTILGNGNTALIINPQEILTT